MELSLRLSMDKASFAENEPLIFSWALLNNSDHDILALSHFAGAEQRHFDYLHLQIIRDADAKTWAPLLFGARDGVAKIACLLPPGERLKHEVDLSAWLKRNRIDIGQGLYTLFAEYRVDSDQAEIGDWAACRDIPPRAMGGLKLRHGAARLPWRGSLQSNRLVFRVGE